MDTERRQKGPGRPPTIVSADGCVQTSFRVPKEVLDGACQICETLKTKGRKVSLASVWRHLLASIPKLMSDVAQLLKRVERIEAATADSLNVSTLSAISADLGTVTAGSINGRTLIRDGAIITDKLAANAVTAEKIQAGTITASTISADVVTAMTGDWPVEERIPINTDSGVVTIGPYWIRPKSHDDNGVVH